MTYRYWYVALDKNELEFGTTQTDEADLGPLPFSTEMAFKKISRLAEELGRRVLRIKRIRSY